MADKNGYIAVFDSGVGGLSVLRELIRLMPQERYLYFGDSANAPYGVRPVEQVRELTLAAARRLMDRGCKALVVACNTATAAAITDLRQRYPDTIVVGIEPALKLAADHFPQARVGVLATPLTLREEKFAHLAERFPQMQVTAIPLPGLVELIENGGAEAEIEAFLRPVLQPYAGKLDAAVLGCTHYPLVAAAISRLLGVNTVLLDGGRGTAMQTRRRLEQAGLLWDGPGELLIENSTDDPEKLRLSRRLLEESV